VNNWKNGFIHDELLFTSNVITQIAIKFHETSNSNKLQTHLLFNSVFSSFFSSRTTLWVINILRNIRRNLIMTQ